MAKKNKPTDRYVFRHLKKEESSPQTEPGKNIAHELARISGESDMGIKLFSSPFIREDSPSTQPRRSIASELEKMKREGINPFGKSLSAESLHSQSHLFENVRSKKVRNTSLKQSVIYVNEDITSSNEGLTSSNFVVKKSFTTKPYQITVEKMQGIERALSEMRQVTGFRGGIVILPSGEELAQVGPASLKLAEIGAIANDVLLRARSAAKLMDVGDKNVAIEMIAQNARILLRCLGSDSDLHVHLCFVMEKDANIGMAKIWIKKISKKILAVMS